MSCTAIVSLSDWNKWNLAHLFNEIGLRREDEEKCSIDYPSIFESPFYPHISENIRNMMEPFNPLTRKVADEYGMRGMTNPFCVCFTTITNDQIPCRPLRTEMEVCRG